MSVEIVGHHTSTPPLCSVGVKFLTQRGVECPNGPCANGCRRQNPGIQRCKECMGRNNRMRGVDVVCFGPPTFPLCSVGVKFLTQRGVECPDGPCANGCSRLYPGIQGYKECMGRKNRMRGVAVVSFGPPRPLFVGWA